MKIHNVQWTLLFPNFIHKIALMSRWPLKIFRSNVIRFTGITLTKEFIPFTNSNSLRKLSKWIMVHFKGLNLIKGQITNTFNVLTIKTPLVAFVILVCANKYQNQTFCKVTCIPFVYPESKCRWDTNGYLALVTVDMHA